MCRLNPLQLSCVEAGVQFAALSGRSPREPEGGDSVGVKRMTPHSLRQQKGNECQIPAALRVCGGSWASKQLTGSFSKDELPHADGSSSILLSVSSPLRPPFPALFSDLEAAAGWVPAAAWVPGRAAPWQSVLSASLVHITSTHICVQPRERAACGLVQRTNIPFSPSVLLSHSVSAQPTRSPWQPVH